MSETGIEILPASSPLAGIGLIANRRSHKLTRSCLNVEARRTTPRRTEGL